MSFVVSSSDCFSSMVASSFPIVSSTGSYSPISFLITNTPFLWKRDLSDIPASRIMSPLGNRSATLRIM